MTKILKGRDPAIQSKAATPEYRNNYDRIFGVKDETTCPDGAHSYPVQSTGFLECQITLRCERCGHEPIGGSR